MGIGNTDLQPTMGNVSVLGPYVRLVIHRMSTIKVTGELRHGSDEQVCHVHVSFNNFHVIIAILGVTH